MPSKEDLYWESFLSVFFDRMSVQIRKNMSKMVESYGLNSSHAIYLIALRLQDGQTLVSLSKFLDMDKNNTTRVIKILREKGLVYDDRTSESSKKYSIFLTEEGRTLADHIREGIIEDNNQYFRDISREDILHMRNTLIRILNNMDLNLDEYMASKYEDPFYTHLNIVPLDNDYVTEPIILENRSQSNKRR